MYTTYTTYILPSGGLYATYHLLGEPETTIDMAGNQRAIQANMETTSWLPGYHDGHVAKLN